MILMRMSSFASCGKGRVLIAALATPEGDVLEILALAFIITRALLAQGFKD